jgi:hypothetical protein
MGGEGSRSFFGGFQVFLKGDSVVQVFLFGAVNQGDGSFSGITEDLRY